MDKQALVGASAQGASAWRDRFARYASSHQTVNAFCRSEAVSVATFYAWRARLRDSGGAMSRAPHPAPLAKAASFIDLGKVKSESIRATGASPAPASDAAPTTINLRLDLGGGIVLHIVKH